MKPFGRIVEQKQSKMMAVNMVFKGNACDNETNKGNIFGVS